MSSSRADRKELVQELTQKARQALWQASVVGKKLTVAVSGGPDSLALLHILAELRKPLGIGLHVAHLDHGLREESATEAAFVASEAHRLGLPFSGLRQDVASHRRQRGLSLEEAARELRYRFLAGVAKEVGAEAIALGHTADDQAETILLHLVRGSGLAGLQGMKLTTPFLAPDRDLVTLVRPLLGVTREETEAYCRLRGLAPLRDPSNADLSFSRNRLRIQVLPLLRQINPSVRDALLRLSHAVTLDVAYLNSEVLRYWPQIVEQTAMGLALDRKALAQLDPSLRRHLLRRAYTILRGLSADLEQNHVEKMVQLLEGPSGKAIAVPGGVRWEVGYDKAFLTLGDRLPDLPPVAKLHPLTWPGEKVLDGWIVQAAEALPLLPAPHPYVASFDLESLGVPISIRSRQPGDRFQPLGMEGPGASKKLQDFFVDSKVPRTWRSRVPLVVSPRGIAWVVGWRIAHWARVTPQTRRCLRLEFRRQI